MSILSSSAAAGPPIKLDQLIALNQEMVALSRAGVPLNQGLLHLGRDLPGRLGELAQQLGQRLETGQPLTEALQSIPGIPPMYAAMVAAGLRSGRLAVALEDMSGLIRRVAEMRRLVSASLIYPLFLLFVAVLLFSFTLTKCFPIIRDFYHSTAPASQALIVLDWLAATRWYWVPVLAGLTLIGLVIVVPRALLRTGFRLTGLQGPMLITDLLLGVVGRRRAVPQAAGVGYARKHATIGSVVYMGRMATLAETLATLIQHRVPMPEALRLASDACGDRRVRDSGHRLAERLEAGEIIQAREALDGAPRMLALVLLGGGSTDRMAATLQRMAESYRQEALWISRWVAVYVPLCFTVLIGGAVTAAYALSLLWPFVNVLLELSKPIM